MDIGVIGLGAMGNRIATVLLDSGHAVIVHDVSPVAIERAAEAGATPADSAAEVGAAASVVLLSLPQPEHVVAAVADKEGLLSRPADGLVIVDTSTVDPETTRHLAEKASEAGAEYLDAPVLGRPDGCGQWTLPVGGSPEALEIARPALEPLASGVTHVGQSGAGHAIKLLNNLMFGAINAITVEAFAIAARAGVSPETFFHTVSNSGAATVSGLFRELGPKIIERDFSPTFTTDLLYKDISLAADMAEDAGVPIIVGDSVKTLTGLARTAGYGEKDTSAVLKVYETLLGANVTGHGGTSG